ncbi:zinc finger protein [Macleaya cordata]|uniref:Zinc finger protein n=1 Tax=Macleaya cordata TaxID=56857 RepID=A0A200RB61_MACCD|nr:zinc finger protein [Macleaya cordata]
MQNVGSDHGSGIASEDHRIECSNLEENQGMSENLPQEKKRGDDGQSSSVDCHDKGDQTVVSIVICDGDSVNQNQVPVNSELKGNVISNGGETKLDALKITGTKMGEVTNAVMSPKKGSLSRNESSREQCRVCQQQSEEALVDLGCQCRGGLAKAHLSCIGTWFSTRGSNKCEICQQVAVNVPPPESQPSRNYWIWRIDPNTGTGREGERGCYSPLWVALSILIGGLLLDVLISISLGVSALPVNIIIGVLVVLGLGTALRLAFECCQEIHIRRTVQRMETNGNPEYHPTIWQNL